MISDYQKAKIKLKTKISSIFIIIIITFITLCVLTPIVSAGSQSAQDLYNIGVYFLNSDLYIGAINAFSEAIELNPDFMQVVPI